MVYIIRAKKGKAVRYVGSKGTKKVGRLPVAVTTKEIAERIVSAKKRELKGNPRAKGWNFKIVKV